MPMRYWLGAVGSWDYGDATEIVDRVLLPTDGLETSADGVSPAVSTTIIDDPEGDYVITGWHPIWADEDDCTPPRIWTGLVLERTYTRGPTARTAAGRTIGTQVTDLNALLKFRVIRGAVGNRPAETVAERLAWLFAGTLAGLVFDTGLCDLTGSDRPVEANDYRHRFAADVLNDLAETFGRDIYVIWDALADAGEEVSLVCEQRLITQRSATISISNVMGTAADESPGPSGTCCLPTEDSSLGRTPESVYSGDDFTYANGANLYLTNPTTNAAFFGDFGPRDFVFTTDRVRSPDTAATHAANQLIAHSGEDDTITTTLLLPKEKVNHVYAGHAIDVRYTHFPGYETTITTKVLRRSVSEIVRDDSYIAYAVTLQLTRSAKGGSVIGGPPGDEPHTPPGTAGCTPTFTLLHGTSGGASATRAEIYDTGVFSSYAPGPANSGGNATDQYYGVGPDPNAPAVSKVEFPFFALDPVHTYERRLTIKHSPAISFWAFRKYPTNNPGTVDFDTVAWSPDSTNGTDGTWNTVPFAVTGPYPNGPTSDPQSSDGYRLYTLDHSVGPATFTRYSENFGTSSVIVGILADTFWEVTQLECAATPMPDEEPPQSGQEVPWEPAATVVPGTTTTGASTKWPYAPGSLKVRVDGVDILAAHVTETDPASGGFTLDWPIDPDETVTVTYDAGGGFAPLSASYGPAIGMRSLANTTLGQSGPRKSTMRFRAEQSSTLASIKVYLQGPATGGGYGSGTGGTAVFTVQADDGTAAHLPSGTALATETHVHPDTDADFPLTFSSPASLTAGTLYHLVCENTDADPTTNSFSLNYIWQNPVPSPHQPKYPADTDWGHAYLSHSTGLWVQVPSQSPILDMTYGNGSHQGVGYIEVSAGSDAASMSGTAMVRELFTVSGGDRTVAGAAVRVMRESGADALTVGLYTSGDALIDSFTIAAADVPTGDIATHPTCGPAAYVSGRFAASHVLTNATQYYLRLSTASASQYWMCPIRRGDVSYNYHASTVFADGLCSKWNGSSWVSLGAVANENNLQFYFTAP